MTKPNQKNKLTKYFSITNNVKSNSSSILSHSHTSSSSANSSSSTLSSNISNLKKSIYNPYTKKVTNRINLTPPVPDTPSTQTTIYENSHSCPLDDKWVGTKMSKRPHGWRILLQNPNGINLDDNFSDFKTLLYDIRDSSVDMLLLSETKLNPMNTRVHETIKDMQEKVFPGGDVFMTNTPGFPTFTPNQPGGVLTLLRRKLKTRVSSVQHDRLGRWNKLTFYGKTSHLHIYNVYRVIAGSTGSGDSTAWMQQYHQINNKKSTLQYTNRKQNDPRHHVISQLLESVEQDLFQSDEVIIAGDFNETLNSRDKTHIKFTSLGLQQIFTLLNHPLPRSTKKGTYCIDHVWASGKVAYNINALGFCPFNQFCDSDHRALYLDIDIKSLLHYTSNPIQSHAFRRLKTSIIPNLKKYQQRIEKQCAAHKLPDQLSSLQEAFRLYGNDPSNIKRLNKLDSLVTRIMRSSEKRCSKASRHCIDDWSPELKRTYKLKRNISQQIRKFRTKQQKGIPIDNSTLTTLLQNRREIRKKARELRQQSIHHREQYLRAQADYKAKGDRDKANNIYSTLLHIENQRRQARVINKKIKGTTFNPLLYILIPAQSAYDTQVNHYDVTTIWNRIQQNNGHDIHEWERVESRKEIESMLIQWMNLHSAQSRDSPLTSIKWRKKLNDLKFRSAILSGSYTYDVNERQEINEMFQIMQKYDITTTIPFEYTYREFLTFIRNCKEKSSSSPSGRHLGHLKALSLMPDQTLLEVIHGILTLSMKHCVPLKRYCQVVTTLLEKEHRAPKIHRLRPITIVEAELNAISKSYWSKKLAAHIEHNHTMTENQYGGRKLHQAQSAVLNKLLYYNYQFLMSEDAAWVDKDARNCFDRLLPQLTTLQSECHGADRSSTTFMLGSLRRQRIKLKTGYGVTPTYYSYTKTNPIFGTGQGMGWSLLACNTNLNVVNNCMEKHCKGMRYFSPDKQIQVNTIGDCFVDDTEHGVNVQPDISPSELLQHIQTNDQKHTFYWHVTGGRIAIDKCSWYYLSFDLSKGIPYPIETNDQLETAPDYSSPTIVVPKFPISRTHKTLGCKVSPTLSQHDQLQAILRLCEKWACKSTNSTLSNIDIIHSYQTILLPSIRYRLVSSMFTFQQCDLIFSKIITPLLHAHSLHRNFNQSIAIAPDTYGGLRLNHFYYIQGIEQIKFFIMHYRRNDKTGKLLKITLQLLQLHCGIAQPFYNKDHSIFSEVIPKTWFSNIWNFLSTCYITLTESKPWIPPFPRKNDKCIMDILIPHIPDKRTHAQLNWCRINLCAFFLSDITDYNGTCILPSVFKGLISRSSNWKWPKCKIPASWWKLWTSYLVNYIQPYLNQHSLGTYTKPTHQKSLWHKTSCGLICNTHNHSLYAKCPNSHHTYRQVHSTITTQPRHEVDVIQFDETVTILAEKNMNVEKQYFKSPMSFDFLRLHPSNKLTKKLMKKIRKHIRNETLVTASDGSAIAGQHGSFAFCLATSNGEILFQSYAPALCEPESVHSDRCEILGLLAIVTTLIEIVEAAKNPARYRNKTILVWSDSETALSAAKKTVVHTTRSALQNNIDVIMELQHQLQYQNLNFKFLWVEAHQDQKERHLSVEAKLNIAMDELAACQYDHNNHEFTRPVPHFPAQQISLSTPYFRITGNFVENLVKYHRDTIVEKHITRKWNIHPSLMPSINWNAIKRTFASVNRTLRPKLLKSLHRQWDTSARKNKWNQYKVSVGNKKLLCPLCSKEEEDCDHVLRCTHTNMMEARKQMYRDFDKLLKSLHTEPTLRRRLISLTKQWMKCYSIPAPRHLNGTIRMINKAIREQQRISFSNFFRGVLVWRWEKIQNKHIQKHKPTLPKQLQNPA